MVPFLTTVLPLVSGAIQILQQFNGNAQVAKVTPYVTEAIGVVTSLSPLLQSYAAGTEVTPDDVRAALAGKDKALAEFDEAIKAAGG
jgi:hypothetical protein